MKHLLKILFVTGALLVLSGASLADEKVMGTPFSGAPDPDGVLKAMERATASGNFSDYRNVLADSFVYVTDLNTVSMYPDIDWTQWGIAEEEEFLERLLSPVIEASINLTNKINERGMPYDGTAQYEITYQINSRGINSVGEATFRFVETDNRWYLWKWEETLPVNRLDGGGSYSSSGEVRASLKP